MIEANFLKENNARHLWHPMAHPADSLANPPDIIVGGDGVEITDVDGHKTVDAVGGLWNVNLGYSCEPVKKKPLRTSLSVCLIIRSSAELRTTLSSS